MDETDTPDPDPPTYAPFSLPPAIAAALVQAQASIRGAAHNAAVKHDTKDSRGNVTGSRTVYTYTSSESLIAAAREALTGAGLCVISEGWRAFPRVEDGGLWHEQQFLVVHTSGAVWRPAAVSLPAIEGRGRPIDKAMLGVDTTLHGYFLRSLLQIDRPDTEEEISARNDDGHEPAPSRETSTLNAEAALKLRIAKARNYSIKLHAAGKLDAAAMADVLRRGSELGLTEATVRGWLPVEASGDPDQQPNGPDPADSVAVDPPDSLAPISALEAADSPEALLGVVATFRDELAALDAAIVGGAFVEHAERLGVAVVSLDATLADV